MARVTQKHLRDRVRRLQRGGYDISIAWAYGGECNRGYEPVEDRMARRDQALPVSMMAERAGLKLTRDVD